MTDMLYAEKINFFYGDNKVLDDVSINIEKGKIFGLIGPDGAGKTTLIRVFCTLLKPYSGACSVEGLDTVTSKAEIVRKIGYLSQRFSLYGDLTVDENINFFAEIHKVKNYSTKKDELLTNMGMIKFKKRVAAALSGGMKQKLALACTLIHTPEIVFLDEPTNGVDPVARREFWDILKNIADEGVTIVISTPYIDEAEKCDRIAFMDKGKIVTAGTPENLRNSYTETLFEFMADDLYKLKGVLESDNNTSSVQIFGNTLHASISEKKNYEELVYEIEKLYGKSLKIRKIAPTLEDFFIKLLESESADV